MGEKDITEKLFEEFPDVFADIVNGLLFNGKTVVRSNQLESMKTLSAYKADGKIRPEDRDVAKRWKKSGIRIACIGFENQSEPDPYMVLRVLGYDGAEYRFQCLKENMQKPKYPVVTLVLYFGYRHRWNKAKTLYETVNVPEEFKPFVKDVEINLFEIAYLTDEQVKLFKSDFRIVADYFVQKRKNGTYKPSRKKIKHIQSLLELFSVVENDKRFENLLQDDDVAEGRLQNMCDVMDRAEKIGGDMREAEVREQVATDLIKKGNMTAEFISDISKLSVKTIQKMAKAMGVVLA